MCEQKKIGATSKEKTETRFQTYSPLLIYLKPLKKGGSISGGTPKWMVYNGNSPSQMDDDWGYPNDLLETSMKNTEEIFPR